MGYSFYYVISDISEEDALNKLKDGKREHSAFNLSYHVHDTAEDYYSFITNVASSQSEVDTCNWCKIIVEILECHGKFKYIAYSND